MAGEYILHDGIDDDFNREEQELRYASVINGKSNSSAPTGHLSSLMLASDDLEIPLINNDINLHNGGPGVSGSFSSGGGAGGGGSECCCLLGQKGFRPGKSEYSSNKRAKQQLIVATLICFLFMIAELVGGLMAGSLAVVTDAAHLLTDCIGFIVAMVAISFSKKLPDRTMTFGYKRFEVLGAVISVLGIWLLTGVLVYLAVLRIIDKSFEIEADTMIVISTIGVGINIVMASVLHGNCLSVPLPAHGHSHGHGHSHNHSHNKSCKSAQLSTSPLSLPKKDDALLTHGVINMHSTSIYTTHSRHNSFSKTLPNGGNLLLDTSEIIINGSSGGGASTIAPNSVATVTGDKAFTRLNLEHNHNNHQHNNNHNARHNGSYTLLSVGSQEDALHADCDSDDQHHHHHHHHEGGAVGGHEYCDEEGDEDDDEDALGSDLKLGGGDRKSNNNKTKKNISGNINIRAAMIHVIGDFVQSIGVLISAVVIKLYPAAKVVDPICTFVFSVIVFFTTIRIMKESLVILLDAVPRTINLARLEKELRSVDGVRSVHHLNVFGVSVDWNVMMVHLIIDNMTSGEEVIRTVSKLVKRAYNIKHVTVQVERQKAALLPSSSAGNELI